MGEEHAEPKRIDWRGANMRGRGTDDPGQGGGQGRYQVWHANDIQGVELSQIEGEPYVHGYTPLAGVEAGDLQHAVELADHGAAASGSRATAAGDLIVGPLGHAYRVEGLGEFSQVETARLALPSPANRPDGWAARELAREGRTGDGDAARAAAPERLASPSDIAKGRADGPEPANGQDRGNGPVRDHSRGR